MAHESAPMPTPAPHSLLSFNLKAAYYSGLSFASPVLQTVALAWNVGYPMRTESPFWLCVRYRKLSSVAMRLVFVNLRRHRRRNIQSTAVCLICQENVAVSKECNISRHFAAKHPNYASQQPPQERAATAQRLTGNLHTEQHLFHRQTAIQESTTKAVILLAFKLANASKPFSEDEF